MIGMRIDRVKGLFFDKPGVLREMDRATVRVFNRFGATTRLIARRSIRRAGKNAAPSAPGQPPKTRTGLLREHIYYAYDRASKSVVIGPALFARSSWAHFILEHGGTTIKKNLRRRIRKPGDGGEIRIDEGLPSRTMKLVQDYRGEACDVIYAHLATQAQADRANRLNEELYGPAGQTIRIAPRPYMAPAFAKAQQKLPEFWENAIQST